MGKVSVSYAYVSIEDVIERIKSGASVDEIVTMFAESTCNRECLEHMFSEGLEYKILNSGLPYEETLEKVRDLEIRGDDPEYDENNSYRAEECLGRIQRFREDMRQLSSAAEITEIVDTTTYTGWGEFLSDSIQSFVDDDLDFDTKTLAEDVLGDDWWDEWESATTAFHYSVPDGAVTVTKCGYEDMKDYVLERYLDEYWLSDDNGAEEEISNLEELAAAFDAEHALPSIIDTLLKNDAPKCAKQLLNRMAEQGGEYPKVAEQLKPKVEEAIEKKN